MIWPGDLVFDHKWPSFELDLEIIKTNILSKIHDDCFKNVTARVLTSFLLIRPGDLVLNPKWPSLKLNLDLIEVYTLSKFHQDWVKTMTSRVLTSFSFDFTWWPSFWPQVTQYRTWPRFHRGKHSDQVSSRLGQNCDLLSVNKLIVDDERQTKGDDNSSPWAYAQVS